MQGTYQDARLQGMSQTDAPARLPDPRDQPTPDAPARLPDPQEQPTLNLWPATGQLLGLSRQSTYDAAARGEIPTIRIGRRLLVPTAALRRLLAIDDQAAPAA